MVERRRSVIRLIIAAGRWYLLITGLLVNLVAVAVLFVIADRSPLWIADRADAIGEVFRRVHPRSAAYVHNASEHLRRRVEDGMLEVAFAPFAYFEPPDRAAAAPAKGRIVRVGPTEPLRRPSDAARIAKNGDTVLIAPGVYRGDTAVWRANDLTIRGDGGIVHLDARGARLPQGKGIWRIRGNNVTVEHIEFSGARSRDKNGAGIRSEGSGLVIRNCYFHHNQTGLLTNHVKDSEILIEYSEFAHNGHPSGQAHNLYVGSIRRLTMRGNFVHHAVIGSQIKSRARRNEILYNRILDAYDGRGNYSIDLSNGGRAIIAGNVIQQGPLTENYHLIAFAPERQPGDDHELLVVHNTMVNDRGDGRFVWNNSKGLAYLYNNLFVGAGKPIRGEALVIGNVLVTDPKQPAGVPADTLGGATGSQQNTIAEEAGLAGRERFDYRLKPGAPAVDAGHPLQPVAAFTLPPPYEPSFTQFLRARPVSGPPDAGAFELGRGE